MTEITGTVYLGAQGPPGAGISVGQYNAITAKTDFVYTGTGSPEDVVTAPVGALYVQTDGDPDGTLWKKGAGTGNDGWRRVLGPEKLAQFGWVPDAGAATVSARGMPAVTLTGTGAGAAAATGDQATGRYTLLTSGSTANGNYYQVHSAPIAQTRWNGEYVFHVRPHDLTSVRIWVGLFSADPSQNSTPAASSAIQYAGFRYDDTGDTVWKAGVGDGAADAFSNCSVAPIADTEVWLRIVLASTKIRFFIGDAFEIEKTANLPTSTTNLSAYVSITTRTTAAKALRAGIASFLSV